MNKYLNYKNYSYQNNYSQINKENDYTNHIKMYNKGNNSNYKQQNDNINLLYEPYQGFIRGNMFEELFDPYKLKEPYEIRPMNEQADMLTYIDSLTFACIDLNLFLDVYPNEKNKIDLYNQYNIRKKQLIEEYENKYGPLLLSSNSLNTYPWGWDDKPWPWDN